MSVVHTYRTTTPRTAAQKFSAILAVDKGVANEIRPYAGGYIVVAVDGKAVVFVRS